MMATMSTLNPAAVARWSAFAFAALILLVQISNADAPDVVLWSLVFLPWIAGPAWLAAIVAMRADSTVAAWLCVALEIAAVVSTVWLWMHLYANPDAQNGIAMFLFPIVQFPAILVALLIIHVSIRFFLPESDGES